MVTGNIATLPATDDATLLVRTYFDDPAAWQRLIAALTTPSPLDGFLAVVHIVDDSAYEGLSPVQLVALVPESAPEEVLFIADRVSLDHEEGPILAVPRVPIHWDDELRSYYSDRPEFRIAVNELWGVENNLRLGNMDWTEFSNSTDPDGIHRGF
jgi:hypothetical protein